eukprot:SAG31_NODE_12917_length_906_cov_1.805452_1_plen_38_part_10
MPSLRCDAAVADPAVLERRSYFKCTVVGNKEYTNRHYL